MFRIITLTALAALTISMAHPMDAADAQTRTKEVRPTLQKPPTQPTPRPAKPILETTTNGGLTTGKFVDLIPKFNFLPSATVEGLPGTGYCMSNGAAGGPSQKIAVAVTNIGTLAAGPGKVKVIFDNAPAPQKANFLGVNPNGGGTVKLFDIPAAAWKNSQASFTIIVDSDHQVAESNEFNNKTKGKCIQPAG